MNDSIKPGWKTSEFWLRVLSNLPVLLGLVPGVPSGVVAVVTALAHLSAESYSRQRTDLKSRALEIAADSIEAAAVSVAKPKPMPGGA